MSSDHGQNDHKRDDGFGVVVVAAGSSTRMGGTDKIFAPINGIPLIVHTLRRLAASEAVERMILVVARDAVSMAEALLEQYGVAKVEGVCAGGARRQDSVYAGLQSLGDCQWVAIHDGARPCVDGGILDRALEAVRESGAAVAAVPVTDTIKVVGDNHTITDTPPRANLWAAQTPQVFGAQLLVDAHDSATGEFTDDAAMVEALGHPVKVFLGSYENIKVTTPGDFTMVSQILLVEQ